MEREIICLIICFIVGVLLFYLLKQSCGCNVVEGNLMSNISEMEWKKTCEKLNCHRYNPDSSSPSTDSSCDHDKYICEDILNCSNTDSITIGNITIDNIDDEKTTNVYEYFKCETYCKSPEYIRKECFDNVCDLAGLPPSEWSNMSRYLDLPYNCDQYFSLYYIDLDNDLNNIDIPENTCNLKIKYSNDSYSQLSNILSLENLKNLVTLEVINYDVYMESENKYKNNDENNDENTDPDQIIDLTPIGNQTNLTSLDLSYNGITNIKPLGNLMNLILLGLGGNKITDITPLQHLTKLQDLDLHRNKITNQQLKPLLDLKNLRTLIINRNPITYDDPPVPMLNQRIADNNEQSYSDV